MAASAPAHRFPFPMPFGWFHLAYPQDLPPGAVQTVRAVGRDLVLWRSHGGRVVTHDPYCPHLGAHLGVGGTVTDAGLVCPFHGWCFDAEGACVDIPYSERRHRRARLRTYPTVERNGLVMAWLHPAGAEPLWEVPEVPEHADPAWSDYLVSEHLVRVAPQEMAENAVDPAHFRYVHGTSMVAEVEEYRTDGYCAEMRSKQGYVTPKGNVEGRIDVTSYGPGLSCTWFRGIVDALLVATTLPVEDGLTKVRFHFTTPEPAGKLAELFVAEINRQMTQDIPIWEHKAYLPTPSLADTDGPIMRFRSWYRQFYAEA